jgi:hypothetical protein
MRPICFLTVHFVFENETGIYRRHEWQYKMPRNVTGGSGHRSQRNSESNKTKSNNKIIDALIEDIATEAPEDVHIGRVMRRLGSGFMEVFYLKRVTIENKERLEDTLVRAPLKGGMRGRGKKDVWVDVGSVVVLADTGLGGTPWKIVGVLDDAQITRYRTVCTNADPRLFIKAAPDEVSAEGGIEFTEDAEDVDVDDI